MTPEERLPLLPILVWLALFVASIGLMYLFYEGDAFYRWPVFRTAAILATFTCLWRSTLCASGDGDSHSWSTIEMWPGVYAVIIMPINVFLVYPGAEHLYPGPAKDSALYNFMIALSILHGAGFAVLTWIKWGKIIGN